MEYRSVMFGSAETRKPTLFSRENFRSILTSYVITIRQHHRQTDRRTDRRPTCHGNTTLCVVSRGKGFIKQSEMVIEQTVVVHRMQNAFGVGQIETLNIRGPCRSNLRPANKTKCTLVWPGAQWHEGGTCRLVTRKPCTTTYRNASIGTKFLTSMSSFEQSPAQF